MMKLVAALAISLTSGVAVAGFVCLENILPPGLRISVGIRPSDRNWVVEDTYTISCPQTRSGPTDDCSFPHTFTVNAHNTLTGKWDQIFDNSANPRTLSCGATKKVQEQSFLGNLCANGVYDKVQIIDTVWQGSIVANRGRRRVIVLSCAAKAISQVQDPNQTPL
jgi:hypothetical protein